MLVPAEPRLQLLLLPHRTRVSACEVLNRPILVAGRVVGITESFETGAYADEGFLSDVLGSLFITNEEQSKLRGWTSVGRVQLG
jgi:hypothetical protein